MNLLQYLMSFLSIMSIVLKATDYTHHGVSVHTYLLSEGDCVFNLQNRQITAKDLEKKNLKAVKIVIRNENVEDVDFAWQIVGGEIIAPKVGASLFQYNPIYTASLVACLGMGFIIAFINFLRPIIISHFRASINTLAISDKTKRLSTYSKIVKNQFKKLPPLKDIYQLAGAGVLFLVLSPFCWLSLHLQNKRIFAIWEQNVLSDTFSLESGQTIEKTIVFKPTDIASPSLCLGFCIQNSENQGVPITIILQ